MGVSFGAVQVIRSLAPHMPLATLAPIAKSVGRLSQTPAALRMSRLNRTTGIHIVVATLRHDRQIGPCHLPCWSRHGLGGTGPRRLHGVGKQCLVNQVR